MSKRQRCAEPEPDGQPCNRYVSDDWHCLQCGKPVCKWHSNSITYNNFSHEGSACWCYSCMLDSPTHAEKGALLPRVMFPLMLFHAIENEHQAFQGLAQEALSDKQSGLTHDQRERLQKTLMLLADHDDAAGYSSTQTHQEVYAHLEAIARSLKAEREAQNRRGVKVDEKQ